MMRSLSIRAQVLVGAVVVAYGCNVYKEEMLEGAEEAGGAQTGGEANGSGTGGGSSTVSGGTGGTGGSAAGGTGGDGGPGGVTGGGTGGASGTGGNTGTGGNAGTGGAPVTGGSGGDIGAAGDGGDVGTGGDGGDTGTGGDGGVAVGTGGEETGGVPSGGAETGGAATGGAETGGAATGGAETGGAATGGAETGGAATGGAATGGAACNEPAPPATETEIDLVCVVNDVIELSDGQGTWYVFHDTNGIIMPDTQETSALLEPETLPTARGESLLGVHVVADAGFTEWGAGVAFDFNAASVTSKDIYDVTPYTGMVFWARSESGSFDMKAELMTASVVADTQSGGTCDTSTLSCNDGWGYVITITDTWTEYTLEFSDTFLSQSGWGSAIPFDPTEVLSFQLRAGPGIAFDVWIDDVRFYE